MSKRMEAFEVYVGEKGHVCISQDDYGDSGSVVWFTPEQVDVLIDWLKETKVEALKQKGKAPARKKKN